MASTANRFRFYCAFNRFRRSPAFVVNHRIKPGRERRRAGAVCHSLSRATLMHGCWKRRCCRRCRTAFMAVCASSNVREIKDALSYLRLIANRNDDAAFERVVTRRRAASAIATLDVVRQSSRDRQLTLWRACRRAYRKKALCRARRQRIAALPAELIDALAQWKRPTCRCTSRPTGDQRFRLAHHVRAGKRREGPDLY